MSLLAFIVTFLVIICQSAQDHLYICAFHSLTPRPSTPTGNSVHWAILPADALSTPLCWNSWSCAAKVEFLLQTLSNHIYAPLRSSCCQSAIAKPILSLPASIDGTPSKVAIDITMITIAAQVWLLCHKQCELLLPSAPYRIHLDTLVKQVHDELPMPPIARIPSISILCRLKTLLPQFLNFRCSFQFLGSGRFVPSFPQLPSMQPLNLTPAISRYYLFLSILLCSELMFISLESLPLIHALQSWDIPCEIFQHFPLPPHSRPTFQ